MTFFIAVLFSLLGLGGAIIYTPLFYWSGLSLLSAIPMALLLNMITTASASTNYLKQKMVDTGIALPFILTSLPGAYAGSRLARIIDHDLLILILSISIIFAGIRILFFEIKSTSVITTNIRVASAAFAGFFVSAISSLVG